MPVAKKAYILTDGGKAVVDDGKQSGVILCGEGGTVTAEVAKKYGLSTDSDAAGADTTGATSLAQADAAAQTAQAVADSAKPADRT